MGVKPAVYGGVGAIGVVVGIAFWLMRPTSQTEIKPLPATQKTTKSEPRETQKPDSVTSEMPTPFVLLGTVQASAKANLTTLMPGKVTAVMVTQGAMVRKDQPLIQLDDSDFVGQERSALSGVSAAQSQVSKAQAGYDAQKLKADLDILTARRGLEQAQIRLRQADLSRSAARDDMGSERKLAQENLAKAEIGLTQTRKILQSLEELAKVGGVPRTELEGARTQVKLAEADRDLAQTQLKRLEAGRDGIPYKSALAEQDFEAANAGVKQAQEGVTAAIKAKASVLTVAQTDLQAARANLEQANVGLQRARDSRKLLRLTSPIDGLASKVEIRAGETAQPGMPLVTVVSLDSPRVEALVSARQLATVKMGQSATVRVDAQPDKKFPVVVSEIGRVTEADGRSVRVTFRFRTSEPSIRPGQTARITLSDERQRNEP